MKKRIIITLLFLAVVLGIGSTLTDSALASTKVTASPSKTKVTVNGKSKTFEAYTIKDEDYYKLIDLSYVLKDTYGTFEFEYDKTNDALCIRGGGEIDHYKDVMIQGDGKSKNAVLVYPNIYFNGIQKHLTVYRINETDYYKLSEVMDLINVGVIKNKKTGVVNIDTTKSYEPEFPEITRGDAYYKKIQKALYDAYFKYEGNHWTGGKNDCYVRAYEEIIVPDNATLYVPRGVIFEGFKIKLGNNSRFVVRGKWIVEYPDKYLDPVSTKTKGTLYLRGNTGNQYKEDTEFDISNDDVPEVITVDKDHYDRIVLPLKSADITYSSVVGGIQPITLKFTRDPDDTIVGLNVTFHIKGGSSYSYHLASVDKSLELMPLLTKLIEKNNGKKFTIDKVELQNAGYNQWFDKVIKSETYTIPVKWTVDTTKEAPVYNDKAVFKDNCEFHGLEKVSYVAKYKSIEFDSDSVLTEYALLTPENHYTLLVAPFSERWVIRDRTNIATLAGKKGSGADDYTFTGSKFSNDIMYAVNYDYYPQDVSLTVEGDKTYLNLQIKNAAGEKEKSYDYEVLVKYHKEGDPETTQNNLCVIDMKDKDKRLDLTTALSDLTHKKGSIKIDKLYIYLTGYDETMENYGDVDEIYIPSYQFAELPCEITTTSK